MSKKPAPLTDDGDYITMQMQDDHARNCQGLEFCIHTVPWWRKCRNWGVQGDWLAPHVEDTEESYWRKVTRDMTAEEIRSEILPHISSFYTFWNRPKRWIEYLIEEKEKS